MDRTDRYPSGRILELVAADHNLRELEAVTKALGSDTRLEILHYLGTHTCSVIEIAEALNLPQSTAALHIGILEKAGLVKTDLQPATRGLQKMVARVYDRITIQLPSSREIEETVVDVSMPIGAYVDAQVCPTCGLAGEIGIIGHLDEPSAFFEPERIYAQLLWFHHGFVEYRFPNRLPPNAYLDSLEISFEVCSEAPLHHLNWPSDIYLAINGTEIGIWTSPADFGGERGLLTPLWWDNNNSQYGLLKVWKTTPGGSYVDGVHISNITIKDLNLGPGEPLSVTIGVHENANNVGGMNLFGHKFGNYPQDIILKQRFTRHVQLSR
jgi:predicted transcriptional regulator